MSSAELSHASTQTDSRSKPDCLACKLVGSAAFLGVGLYALQVAHRDGTFAKVRPPGGSLMGGRLAALMGVGEYMFKYLLLLWPDVLVSVIRVLGPGSW